MDYKAAAARWRRAFWAVVDDADAKKILAAKKVSRKKAAPKKKAPARRRKKAPRDLFDFI